VRLGAEDEHRFRIEVEDTGIGIRPDDLGRLFLEFEQLDTSMAKKYAGTGLGLALTRRLVEAQGGSVAVRSELGRGSVFTAVLPRHATAIVEAATSSGPPGARRILIIEDDAADRQWLSRTLLGASFAVDAAATGEEALRLAVDRSYDAVILDLLLPDMPGSQVLNALRRDSRDIGPVIVVSVAPEQGVAEGIEVSAILVKPVDEDVLIGALREAIGPLFALDEAGQDDPAAADPAAGG